MENFKAPVPVEWSNQLVLLTAQLAKYYECSVEHIRDNFRKNRGRFVEGKHYFKIEGEDLKAFRDYTENFRLVETDYTENFRLVETEDDGMFPVVPARTPSLYLWTGRGAARHAKMLSTDKAWDVFEQLEDCYFSRHSSVLTPAPAQLKSSKRSEGQKSPARVYVFRLADGTVFIVKIGQSKNVEERKKEIERKYKVTIERTYYSPFFSRKVARLIERACHQIFSAHSLGKELFDIEFEEACKVINAFVDVIACIPQVSNFERAEKLFAIVSKIESLSENQIEEKALLIRSAKLIADEKFT